METAAQKNRRSDIKGECERLVNRVWIPIERHGLFSTHDGERYRRQPISGVITRVTPKVRGKAARRADKLARRKATHQVVTRKAA